MLDKQSCYAVNKANPDAIVYPSADGHDIHITRENLTNEEFLFWKNWSDTDYHETELHDRRIFDDHVVALNEYLNVSSESLEDMLIAVFEKAAHDRKCSEQVAQLRHILTEKQFRRVWKAYAERIPVAEIAVEENASENSIYVSLNAAKKKFLKNFSFDKKTL
ncbi:MAG: hypothetical protein IKC03_00140 [Oscillospiraceae bacterium]|nr:hypothetical protein [Oscillospiraceae bacterium]